MSDKVYVGQDLDGESVFAASPPNNTDKTEVSDRNEVPHDLRVSELIDNYYAYFTVVGVEWRELDYRLKLQLQIPFEGRRLESLKAACQTPELWEKYEGTFTTSRMSKPPYPDGVMIGYTTSCACLMVWGHRFRKDCSPLNLAPDNLDKLGKVSPEALVGLCVRMRVDVLSNYTIRLRAPLTEPVLLRGYSQIPREFVIALDRELGPDATIDYFPQLAKSPTGKTVEFAEKTIAERRAATDAALEVMRSSLHSTINPNSVHPCKPPAEKASEKVASEINKLPLVVPDPSSKEFRFEQLVMEMLATHKRKNQDYGDNLVKSVDFGIHPAVGIAVRMNDKMSRIANFFRKGVLLNESVQDSFSDIAVYALLALVELEQSHYTVKQGGND